jgi:acyl-CoA thioester hydrolase
VTADARAAPARGKLLITAQIPVRWADQDTNRHVNNAMYFTYFEQTRILWLHAQPAVSNPDNHGVIVAKASCNYLRPIPYPETLEIRMHSGSIGRASFSTLYDIFGSDGSTQYADGEVVLVWIDRNTGKSLPLPDSMREALQG